MHRRQCVLAGLLALSLVLTVVYAPLGYPTSAWVGAASISSGVLAAALVFSAHGLRLRGRGQPVRTDATVLAGDGLRTAPGWKTARRRCLNLGLALVACSLLASQLLCQPLPEPLTRRLILASDAWILTRNELTPTGVPAPIDSPSRRLLAAYLEHSLIWHYQATHRVPEGLADPERVMAYLVPLKHRLLSPRAAPHPARAWPVVLSGIGWCDQVNRVAALVLAREFPVSQTFNVCSPEPYAGHTIGRVWSARDRSWLYYDVLSDEVVVYRLNRAGETEYLARTSPAPRRFDPPELGDAFRRAYSASAHGWILNEYAPTFGAYLVGKAWASVSGRSHSAPVPANLQAAVQRAETQSRATWARTNGRRHPAPILDAGSRRAFSRVYLEARIEHLLGESTRAAVLYAQAAARPVDPRDDVLGALRRAASVFAELAAETGAPPPDRRSTETARRTHAGNERS